MAKIRNSRPKNSSGGYLRLVGNKRFSDIFVKTQSTVISNGNELEKILYRLANSFDDLDEFIQKSDKNQIKNGVYLCNKKAIKNSKYQLKSHEPDFLIFIINGNYKECYVLELKDGDSFDTKKSESERNHLIEYTNFIAPQISFNTKFFICCFNQNDKKEIVAGLKNKFSIDEVLTGRELCGILGIDYDYIINLRN